VIQVVAELLQLSIEPDGSLGHADHILAILEEANAESKYPREERRFCATLRRADGTIQGGVTARSFWGWLYIASIAIAPTWRGHGYGRQLLAAAQAWGLECACHDAWLMTMSFQARGFYEHAGYRVFAELPSFPGQQSRLFMRKSLTLVGN
jgi:GNAT superfamily N-acetyltransferase